MRGPKVAAGVAAAVLSIAAAAPAACTPPCPSRPTAPTTTAGGFRDILPPGHQRPRQRRRSSPRSWPPARGRRTTTTSSRCTRDLVYATPGLKAADLGKYFKDSTFGVKPDDVESTIYARAPTSRSCATRASASRTSTAPRAPARCSAPATSPRRTACSSSTCCATLGRARAVELRRRRAGQPRDGRRAVVARALHRGRPPAPVRPARRPLRRRGRRSSQHDATELRRRHQPVHRRGAGSTRRKMPGEYAAIGRPLGPDDWKVTDLIATASLVGGIFGKGGGQELAQVAARCSALADALRQKRGASCGRSSRAFEDPDAPTTVKRQALPLPERPSRRRRSAIAAPRRVARRGLGQAARAHRRRPTGTAAPRRRGTRRGGTSAAGCGSPAACALADGRCPTRCSSRAPSRRPATRSPSSARRSATSRPQILMEEDLHAPGHRRARRAPSPASTSTSSSAAAATTRGARPRPARTSSTPSRCRSATTTHYRFRGQCLADRDARAHQLAGRRTSADQTPPGTQTLHAAAHQARPRRRPRHRTRASRCCSPCCARPTSTRSTPPRGFSDFNDPDKIHDASDFQRAAVEDRLHVQLALRRRQAHRLLQLRQQPGARDGHHRPAADGRRPRSGRAATPTLNTADYTPPRPAPAGRQPADCITSWNNKQARGLRGRRLEPVQLGVPLADARPADRARHRGRQEDDAARAHRRDGGGGHDRPARPGGPAAGAAASSASRRTRSCRPRSRRCKAWAAVGRAPASTSDSDGTYDDADAIRIMDAWWPLWMQGAVPAGRWARRCFDTLRPPARSTTPPTTTATTSARPTRTGFYGYVKKDLERVLRPTVKQRYAARVLRRGQPRRCRTRAAPVAAAALAVPADQALLRRRDLRRRPSAPATRLLRRRQLPRRSAASPSR